MYGGWRVSDASMTQGSVEVDLSFLSGDYCGLFSKFGVYPGQGILSLALPGMFLLWTSTSPKTSYSQGSSLNDLK